MTQARSIQISLVDTPYYHRFARCVRRAFLYGVDDFSGRNYEHRRPWIVGKLRSLSSVFTMDICAYALMSYHSHVVRVDEDTAERRDFVRIIEETTKLKSCEIGNFHDLDFMYPASESAYSILQSAGADLIADPVGVATGDWYRKRSTNWSPDAR
ncbi:hypothetical protein [Nitrosococcus oceani]|uniref:hypothetical protein n=1 Tax=Nitrosococcus oceani TaxID=1229 RepID=UPI001E29AA96